MNLFLVWTGQVGGTHRSLHLAAESAWEAAVILANANGYALVTARTEEGYDAIVALAGAGDPRIELELELGTHALRGAS